jgi:decaprenyl-phosphate phosphoribosyltransferase
VLRTAVEILHATRPKQWVKNALIVAPVLLGDGLAGVLHSATVVAVAGFTAVSAAVYLMNDVADAAEDRTHPRKRHRPIAAGRVGVTTAAGTAVALATCGMAAGSWTGTALWFATYIVVNAAYTFGLKRVPYLEMAVVASGFPVRVAIGVTLLGDEVTWASTLLVVSFCGALIILTGKRYGEIAEHGRGSRTVLRRYSTRSIAVTGVAATVIAFATTASWVLTYGAAGVTVLVPFTIGAARVAVLASRGRLAEPERLAVDPVTVSAAVATTAAAAWLLMHH